MPRHQLVTNGVYLNNRINQQIRATSVRVIDDKGNQLGVLSLAEALYKAKESNLDLVEVSATSKPPVVKIMDFGKFKFEEAKEAKRAKKNQHVTHIKEIKLSPNIGEHDLEFKSRHAREFLKEGNKVKLTMVFRGRQITHSDLGKIVVDGIVEKLSDISKIEQEVKFEGKHMIMVLAPK